MELNNIVYVAINKETKQVIGGAKEQYAFKNKGTLRRSVHHSLKWIAEREGIKPSDMYEIHELDLTKVLQLS